MISKSRIMLVFSVLSATALHAAGLWVAGGGAPVRIESGTGAAEARIGSSFADMARGIARPASDGTTTPNRRTDRVVSPVRPGHALRPETPAASTAAPVQTARIAAPLAPAPAVAPATAIPAAPPPTAAPAPDAPSLQGATDPPANGDPRPVPPAAVTVPAAVDRSAPAPAVPSGKHVIGDTVRLNQKIGNEGCPRPGAAQHILCAKRFHRLSDWRAQLIILLRSQMTSSTDLRFHRRDHVANSDAFGPCGEGKLHAVLKHRFGER